METSALDNSLEKAVFAGGCFWCTEAVFKRVKGVEKVTSGYAGGELENPSYERVTSGNTDHVEAIELEFDPAQISYEQLLEIFWATHDPTSLNRQGSDVGSQYRSSIFFTNDAQKEKAERSKAEIEKGGLLQKNIVTTIEPLLKFYKAESYHQNYYDLNKNSNPYCSIVIDPKIQKLLEKFNSVVKEEYKQNLR